MRTRDKINTETSTIFIKRLSFLLKKTKCMIAGSANAMIIAAKLPSPR